jgi:uncharacterized protein YegL
MEHDASMRRLPIYLLLDTSGSMLGDPIESVRQGVRYLMNELRGDPQALESVWLSVITFASDAKQVVPLTPIDRFVEPTFDARGTTALGSALKLLTDVMAKEVRKNTDQHKGDWKPLVFLMTDGEPTDSWQDQANAFKSRPPAQMIAVGAGSQVNAANLKLLTDQAFMMRNYNPDAFKAFFKWASQSIIQSSHKAPEATPEGVPSQSNQSSPLPPPPPQIQLVP